MTQILIQEPNNKLNQYLTARRVQVCEAASSPFPVPVPLVPEFQATRRARVQQEIQTMFGVNCFPMSRWSREFHIVRL